MPQVAIGGALALGGALGLGGAATAGLATVVGTIATSPLLVAGISFGAQALASALSRPTLPSQGAVNAPEIKGSIRQPVPVQRVVYGTQRIGGSVFFMEVDPPYLYLGLLLSARKITRFGEVTIGETVATFDESLLSTTAAVAGAATNSPFYDGSAYLWRSFRDGSADQAIDTILAADFTSLASTFRQRGIATAVLKFHYGDDADHHLALWGNVQVPTVLIEVDGAPVYDPRDLNQSRDDADTWQFSSNAALIQADFLRASYGGRVPADRIDYDQVGIAADYDDELVGLKGGGFAKRHTIDGVVTKDQRPADVVAAMLTANRGFLVQQSGKVWMVSSGPRTAVAAIDDSALAGGFQFRAAQPKNKLLNRVRVRFVAPDRSYELADGPVLERSDLETIDGELLDASLDLPFTLTHQRAQRLGAGFLAESRIGKALSCQVPVRRFLGLKAGDVLTVQSDLYPQMDGSYQVDRLAYADNFATLALELAEYDGTIDAAWTPSSDEQDFDLADLDLS